MEQYLVQIKVTAKLAGWPKRTGESRLVTALKGKAHAILTAESLTLRSDFELVAKLLRSTRFASEAIPEIWRAAQERR